MKKWPIETQILAGFAMALGVLAIMGALIYQSSQTLVQTHRAAQRSQQALTVLEEIFSRMSRAEAEQRLYFLTGEEIDLRQRQAALTRIDQLVAQLRELTADASALREQLPELEQRIADRRRLLEAALERRQRLTAWGRTEMQQLEQSITRMQSAELARLESRQQAARMNANRTLAFVILLLAAALVSVSALYWRIRREIRERQQAQDGLAHQTEGLREGATRLHAIVDTATDGIIVIDDRGVVDSFNNAAERMFGYTATEVIGNNISMLMPPPDREQHDGYLARYLGGGAPRIIGIGRAVQARRKDGSVFPMDLAVSEMRLGGRRMFTGIVRDITERKRAEEQRAQLIQELQGANDELTNFAYVVSHDLKAPLRAISSLADWLESDYGDRLDAEGREHLQLMKSRVRRMDRLIDGILEYSRIGRVKEAPAAVDVDTIVKETIDLLAPPAHIRVTIDGALPSVTAEPTRVRQVFQNLVSNAIKYMDKPQGSIRISCRAVNRMWQFSIADNGPGIDARHHEKIFQLFQTLAPRDRIESTGVGLALVKKIVELYGGRVWVESALGEGSTFHFTLPREAVSAHSNEGAKS